MRRLIDSVIRILCVAALGMLCFSLSGCTKEKYALRANYCYWGSVVDEDGNPIKGINVIMNGMILGMSDVQYTTVTNEKGEFGSGSFSTLDTSIDTIDFVDVDGEENGGDFQSVTIQVKDMVEKQLSEGNEDWFLGTFAYIADIKLKKK